LKIIQIGWSKWFSVKTNDLLITPSRSRKTALATEKITTWSPFAEAQDWKPNNAKQHLGKPQHGE
jgi:hypothetical protein